jgi:hypothetical protein
VIEARKRDAVAHEHAVEAVARLRRGREERRVQEQEAVTAVTEDLDPTAVLRPADIAERLGVDARSVRRAIGRRELTASRACGLRVLAADAAAWWAASSELVHPSPQHRWSGMFAKAFPPGVCPCRLARRRGHDFPAQHA